jgi:hypothetical protein
MMNLFKANKILAIEQERFSLKGPGILSPGGSSIFHRHFIYSGKSLFN